jgi:hypothetical protein
VHDTFRALSLSVWKSKEPLSEAKWEGCQLRSVAWVQFGPSHWMWWSFI